MIYFDEDSDARFFRPEAGTMTTRDLDVILQNLQKTNISVYIVGINAQSVNYPSRIVESFLDGFDIRLGMNQEILRGSLNPWAYRRRANASVLQAAGIDSNAYLIQGARKKNISPWVGIRMNDIHDGHDENSELHTQLWRNHPELRIPGNIPCENGFDFSHDKIRKIFIELAEEAFHLYKPDNILLDWMRWPFFFPRGTGEKNACLITDMLHEIKKRIGRPFACRVPLSPENAIKLGLDVQKWVQDGLLSHLFIGNFLCSGEFNAPVEEWRRIAGQLPIIVSLEGGAWADGVKIQKGSSSSVEEMRAMAEAAYWRGADGVHPFNCMAYLNGERTDDQYLQLLRELDSPELLHTLPRRHHIGWDDSDVWLGDLDQITRIKGYFEKWCQENHLPKGSLPISGPAKITIHTGKAPKQQATLTTDATGIKVNGHELAGKSPYTIAPEFMRDGTTLIETSSDIRKLYLDL